MEKGAPLLILVPGKQSNKCLVISLFLSRATQKWLSRTYLSSAPIVRSNQILKELSCPISIMSTNSIHFNSDLGFLEK